MSITRNTRRSTALTLRPGETRPTAPARTGPTTTAVTAAAGPHYSGRQPGVPDFALTNEQLEVDRFVDEIGWVGFYVQIKAMLGAMCPWIPEQKIGRDWVPCEDPRIAGILDLIRPPRRSQAGLRFRSLRLQASIGEHAFFPVTTPGRGLTFDIAHPGQLRKGQTAGTFGVATRRDANPTTGLGYTEHPRDHLHRHWIEDDKWPDEAKPSLSAVRPEMRVYESVVRNLQRSSDSRLLMNNLLWISNDYGGTEGDRWIEDPDGLTGDDVPNTPEGTGLTELIREFSRLGARAFSDHLGKDVASVLPFPFPHHTKPEMVDLGGNVDKEVLKSLTEIVFAAARGLNIPTQFLVSGEASANHWNDAELRRALHERAVFPELEANNEFWTEYAFRPLLSLSKSGLMSLGDDDPEEYRIGVDTSVLDVKSDSLAHVSTAIQEGIASREWAADKLGVPRGEMLEVPVDVDDYEHWIYSRATLPRATTESAEGETPTEPVQAAALALIRGT